MLTRCLLLSCLLLLSCREKKELKTIYVPDSQNRTVDDNVPSPIEPRTVILVDAASFSLSSLDKVPQKIMELTKNEFTPGSPALEEFLISELNTFGCAIDRSFVSSQCQLPTDIEGLDYIWELAGKLQMLAWNNNHNVKSLNDSIAKLSGDIKGRIEKVDAYISFLQTNSQIRRQVLEGFTMSVSRVVTNGAIRNRVGLINLLKLKYNLPFTQFLTSKNIETIFVHQSGMLSLSESNLLIGWDLTPAEIMAKLSSL